MAHTDDEQSYSSRKYKRFTKDCSIRFSVVEPDKMTNQAKAIDISGGGARIKSDCDIPLGSILTLEILLPHSRNPVVALGKVAWLKKNSDGTFEQGIEFWGMGHADAEDASMAPFEATRTE
ncbi:MAG: PilZ domain-containing protein [Planctomycetes bacterium]|nr:PilZ domain-containing protein [Planctomycetota bacterium]